MSNETCSYCGAAIIHEIHEMNPPGTRDIVEWDSAHQPDGWECRGNRLAQEREKNERLRRLVGELAHGLRHIHGQMDAHDATANQPYVEDLRNQAEAALAQGE